ncbi:hypothetical protein [Rhizobium sp. R693]|uniref:hypothetical protein n=1 Tax=Rhizobium sp. R693 TaxID=1764276 RepID=UPI000B5338A1|nr:hypothetical protein [Rhizobium sp. R693]OWV90392.1 hypothetical protein ATY79_28540 [Rhizobium sp. R693]
MFLSLARTIVSFTAKWAVIFVLAVITVFWMMKVLWWAGFSYLPIVFMFLWPVWVPAVMVAMAILNLVYNLIERGPARQTGEASSQLPKAKLPYYAD